MFVFGLFFSALFAPAQAQTLNTLPTYALGVCGGTGEVGCVTPSTLPSGRYWGADSLSTVFGSISSVSGIVLKTPSLEPLPNPSPYYGDASFLASLPATTSSIYVPSSVCGLGLLSDLDPLKTILHDAYINRGTAVFEVILPSVDLYGNDCHIYLDEPIMLHSNIRLIGGPNAKTVLKVRPAITWPNTGVGMVMVTRTTERTSPPVPYLVRPPAYSTWAASGPDYVFTGTYDDVPNDVVIQDIAIDVLGAYSPLLFGVFIADGAHHVAVQGVEVVSAPRFGLVVETGHDIEVRRSVFHHTTIHGFGSMKLPAIWDTTTSRQFCAAEYYRSTGIPLPFDPRPASTFWLDVSKAAELAEVNAILDWCAPRNILFAANLSYENGGMALNTHHRTGSVFGNYLVSSATAGYVAKFAEGQDVDVWHNAFVNYEDTAVRAMAVDDQHRTPGGSVWHANHFVIDQPAYYVAEFSGQQELLFCSSNTFDYEPLGVNISDVKLYERSFKTREAATAVCHPPKFHWGGLATDFGPSVSCAGSCVRRTVTGKGTVEEYEVPACTGSPSPAYWWYHKTSVGWTQSGGNTVSDIPAACP